MEIVAYALAGASLVFGCLTGWVASQKHRSIEEGVILGALFGPIGTFVETMLPNMTAEERAAINAMKKSRVGGSGQLESRRRPQRQAARPFTP